MRWLFRVNISYAAAGVIILRGIGRSSPRAKAKILPASSRQVCRSAEGHNTFEHREDGQDTLLCKICCRRGVVAARMLVGLMVFGKAFQTTKGAPAQDIFAT